MTTVKDVFYPFLKLETNDCSPRENIWLECKAFDVEGAVEHTAVCYFFHDNDMGRVMYHDGDEYSGEYGEIVEGQIYSPYIRVCGYGDSPYVARADDDPISLPLGAEVKFLEDGKSFTVKRVDEDDDLTPGKHVFRIVKLVDAQEGNHERF